MKVKFHRDIFHMNLATFKPFCYGCSFSSYIPEDLKKNTEDVEHCSAYAHQTMLLHKAWLGRCVVEPVSRVKFALGMLTPILCLQSSSDNEEMNVSRR